MPHALKELDTMPFETTDVPQTWQLLFEFVDVSLT